MKPPQVSTPTGMQRQVALGEAVALLEEGRGPERALQGVGPGVVRAADPAARSDPARSPRAPAATRGGGRRCSAPASVPSLVRTTSTLSPATSYDQVVARARAAPPPGRRRTTPGRRCAPSPARRARPRGSSRGAACAPARSPRNLAALGAVEEHPDREIVGEVLEPVGHVRRHKEEIARTEPMPDVCRSELAAPGTTT